MRMKGLRLHLTREKIRIIGTQTLTLDTKTTNHEEIQAIISQGTKSLLNQL
jgi:hypothetical protein